MNKYGMKFREKAQEGESYHTNMEVGALDIDENSSVKLRSLPRLKQREKKMKQSALQNRPRRQGQEILDQQAQVWRGVQAYDECGGLKKQKPFGIMLNGIIIRNQKTCTALTYHRGSGQGGEEKMIYKESGPKSLSNQKESSGRLPLPVTASKLKMT